MEPALTCAVLTLDEAEEDPTSKGLGALFDAHHARLFRLAVRLLGEREEASDLVQETFLRAAERPGSLPLGDQRLEQWLVRTLVNACRDRQRRLVVRRRAEPLLRLPEPLLADPLRPLAAREAVNAALARLTPRQRAVIVLHELEELDPGEIARLLGLARVTVRWHLAAGRRRLRELLLDTSIRF